MRSTRGHSSAGKQRALWAYIRGLLPADAQVVVAGDSELGSVAVLQLLERWGWGYVMRQRAAPAKQSCPDATRARFDSLARRGAAPQWFPKARLTRIHGHPVRLITWWKAGEPEPWLLATNLPTLREGLRIYKRRMWTEEMFGDFKKHGFDLESSHLRHFLRLSRLTLLIAFI